MSKGSRPSSRIFCTFASFSFTSLSYAATSRTLELPQPQPQQHKIATSLHLLVAHCIQHTTHEHNVYKHAQCIIRSEEHTSELQSLMRISYAVFCLKKTTQQKALK